ncbi:DUF3883 domain-containing protein [Empedobacter falsenii]|uniref:protein NO VEIN domain-containing protein n=1 Tax=Empedobacter sp. 189-2 TaxID=2746724 RepID=UPI002576CF53|nr:DUF3883 domain-containing protein [Empedobacter sp. 189-2]MDM1543647.1 DUF3883 domain-containing protein [Empedobacter sp. 189-2]
MIVSKTYTPICKAGKCIGQQQKATEIYFILATYNSKISIIPFLTLEVLLGVLEQLITALERDEKEKIKQALIPIFYTTLHNKYNYYDLLVFHENKLKFLEIKSSESMNRSFHISKGEIKFCLDNDNYEIIRVFEDSIISLGNPIKELRNQLGGVKNEYINIVPKNDTINYS